MTEPRMIDIR